MIRKRPRPSPFYPLKGLIAHSPSDLTRSLCDRSAWPSTTRRWRRPTHSGDPRTRNYWTLWLEKAPFGLIPPSWKLGCGTGNYIRALCKRAGCGGWGLDPSVAMLAQARTGSPDSLRWICAPAEHTTLADAQFDLAFCVDVIHHLHNCAQAFDEAYRVLRYGGALCVATDSEQIIRRRQPLSVYWPDTIKVELARYPEIATLLTELSEAKFVRLGQEEIEACGWITDPAPYRAKVFSCLRALPDEVYQQGRAQNHTTQHCFSRPLSPKNNLRPKSLSISEPLAYFPA